MSSTFVDEDNIASWNFDKKTNSFHAPVPHPGTGDNKNYTWDEENQAWIEYFDV